jgi:ornithine decarboxylase
MPSELSDTPYACALRRLADEHGTPLLVVRGRQIERNHQILRRLLPDVAIFYAMKANPHPRIVETITGAGGGVEVCSTEEIELCGRLGVEPRRVLYTHPIKTPAQIRKARAYGLDLLVCDNPVELEKVAAHAPGCGILFRVKVTNPFCLINLSEKFGCPVEDLESLVATAQRLGLVPRGICFHVGSQTTSPIPYVETLKMLKDICNRLLVGGVRLDIMDIGGGFPLSHDPLSISMDEFCLPIANTLEHLFGSFNLCCEPGRFLVGNSAVLVSSVVGKAVRDHVNWYYIDDGLYASFSGKVFDKADYPLFAERGGPEHGCVVAGPTCDSFDIVSSDRSLPELEVGDLIWATNIGAYSVASASRFNGFGPGKVLFIDKENDDDLQIA